MNDESENNSLANQLAETIKAEQFFTTESGRLWSELATKEITRLTRDISSDKYLKDHQGYVHAVIELGVWRKMLRKMQVAASPARRAKLEERIAENEQRE